MVTVNDKGYTKHYFEEGKRICSKIGSGGFQDLDILVDQMELNYDEQFEVQREGLHNTFNECFGVSSEINTNDMFVVIKQCDNPGEPVFYYHSDHLGSASYITDDQGNETQHLVYLPFGEDWVDWKYNTSQFDTPYKFNGKEKDPETGLHYYGARYLNTDLSIWLSVDPMSDKYPHLTSYNYCANNPVMLVDPDGREMWEPQVTSKGKVSYVAEQGDTKETFKSQYGLSSTETDKIFKEEGVNNNQIKRGTKIDGEAVKKATGSDILKLDPKSEQSTPQRFVYQTMFGILHSKTTKNNSNITDMSDYINLDGSTGANNSRQYWGNYTIPLLNGGKTTISNFNSSFSKKYSRISLGGEFKSTQDGLRYIQMYEKHPGKGTRINKLIITMPYQSENKFETTYRK